MRKNRFFIRLVLFWLIYFTAFRLFFAFTYKELLPAGHFNDTLRAFVIGLRMDIAATCYLIVIPAILYFLFGLLQRAFIYKVFAAYQAVVISIITLIHILNIYLYQHWGSIINARIFIYARWFEDTLSFISTNELVMHTLLWIVISLLAYLLYHKMAYKYFLAAIMPPEMIKGIKENSIYMLVVSTLLVIGMRGGFQFTPMNESIIYYSSFPMNNNIAANIPWFLGFSVLDESDTKNPYVTMPEAKAKEIVSKMLEHSSNSTMEVLNTKHPNVVIIMLESWTADVVKALGGDTATTPCFDTLRRDGLLFTQAYASGARTDQGLASIISGFPSQPNHSIVNMPEKAKKLPFITNAFVKEGYRTSYYHGGDAEFANMKIYLVNAHFSRIVDRDSFPKESSNGRLGVNDEYVFARHIEDMNKEKQPFFSLIMTLSSHEPFEVPMHHTFSGQDNIFEKFRNAVYYSDHCLGKYLAEASKQKWFNNTLFILVSDHGHYLPWQRWAYDPEAHHIALMFYGGALKEEYRGKEISATTDQCDIAAMLYSQLCFNHAEFSWSKDDLNPTVKHFANYAGDFEAGIISGNQHLIYHYSSPKIMDFFIGKIPADSLYKCSHAWLQLYYQQYLNY